MYFINSYYYKLLCQITINCKKVVIKKQNRAYLRMTFLHLCKK